MDRRPFPTRRRPRGGARVRLLAAARGRAEPARARRAEAPRAPARVGARDAPAAAHAEARDHRAVVPLPLDAPELRAPRCDDGVRGLRGRAGSAARAADGRGGVRAPADGLRPRWRDAAGPQARDGRPAHPGRSAYRARVVRGPAHAAPPPSSSTILQRSSSASPRCWRRSGMRRSRQSGSGSSRGSPRASRPPAARSRATGSSRSWSGSRPSCASSRTASASGSTSPRPRSRRRARARRCCSSRASTCGRMSA